MGEGFNLNNLIHSEYNVVEKHLNDRLSDELEIHFLNLAKVKEQEENKETDDREIRIMLAQESAMMRKANATIELMEMNPKERWLYENRMKYEHDKASWKHAGYQEGLEQGVYQKALETAKNLLAMNFSIENIAQATGLSIEEVKAL